MPSSAERPLLARMKARCVTGCCGVMDDLLEALRTGKPGCQG
ncbi:hypothetical protein FEM01_13595 [Pseudomonas mosselii]|uniref:DRF autoregulatory domain-containing protein n=1 Tax=Pseudomonas mosselii TaxID=78327 RepID=A0A5R8Z514_9PSED|nr:hypothetical protein FEM01_13595 [Pseudomonas mosselii]